MRLAYPTDAAYRDETPGRLTFWLLLPLFVMSEALSRLLARHADEEGLPPPERGSLMTAARSQASIATSCALMAISMLQSSERRSRPARLSRP